MVALRGRSGLRRRGDRAFGRGRHAGNRLLRFLYLDALAGIVVAEFVAGAADDLHAFVALLRERTGLRAFIRRAATELAVTDHRVIYKTGLLSRHTIEMNLDKVESVDVDQTLLGRLFGYGTITVRGTGGSLEPIRDIGDPLTFRSFITAGPSTRATHD